MGNTNRDRPFFYFQFGICAFISNYLLETDGKDRLGGPTGEIFLSEGVIFVRGWRTKFIFLLIVYFAGFATAIYTLAPAPESRARQPREKGSAYSAFKSEAFAKSLNSGMHKCVDFSKDAALRTAKFIKEKMDQKPLETDS